jgi:predicted CopG family antitoxin
MGKSVRVHDDTHSALKALKAKKRSKSLDEVIREMIRQSTGQPVEKMAKGRRGAELTAYMDG